MRDFTGDPEHPIARYARDRGISLAELAKRVGIPPQRFSEILHGARARLSWTNSLKVQKATAGALNAAELMNYEPPRKHKKRGRAA